MILVCGMLYSCHVSLMWQINTNTFKMQFKWYITFEVVLNFLVLKTSIEYCNSQNIQTFKYFILTVQDFDVSCKEIFDYYYGNYDKLIWIDLLYFKTSLW